MPNPLNWTNVTDFQGILVAGNSSNSFFWTAMYFMMLVIILASLVILQGFQVGVMVTGFIGILMGMLLVYMGLMGLQWLLMVVGIELLIIFWIYYSSNRDI